MKRQAAKRKARESHGDTTVSNPPPSDLKSAPKTPKGRKRKQELIAAATRALNRIGYRELSVADIAEEAGAPISLFYRYFRNKTEIVVEALNEIVAQHKARMPAGASSFFEFQVAAHRNLIRLFTEAPGLLGCYYSFDYGESAFASLFHDQTLNFNRMHAERAIASAEGLRGLSADALTPLAHALTAMTDNFAFRYSTGRDETAALEKAARADVAMLLAQLRLRAFTLGDQGVSQPLLPPIGAAQAGAQRPEIPSVGLANVSAHKRLPKRADSTASYGALKSAALRLMNRLSYDEMRLRDIEDEGGVTRGGIYHYFGEKRDLVMLLLRERIEAMQAQLERVATRPPATAFEDLEAMIGVFMEEYHANPGIVRIFYRVEQNDAEAADLLAAYRRVWARAFADLASFHLKASPAWRNVLILVGYAILAMIERFSYDLHVLPFTEISSRVPPNLQARFLAEIWMRALFLSAPEGSDSVGAPLLPVPRVGTASAGIVKSEV